MRGGGIQATTMQATSDITAQVVQATTAQAQPRTPAEALAHWSGLLSVFSSQPGDAALNSIADCLLDMSSDTALPDNVRSAALSTFIDTPDDARAQAFQAFSAAVRNESNAAMQFSRQTAPMQPGIPVAQTARNFGGAPQTATGSAPVSPFVRIAPDVTPPIAPMHPGPLTDEAAYGLDPRERPQLDMSSNWKVNQTVQYILQHPESTTVEIAKNAMDTGLRKTSESSRSMVSDARDRISFGLNESDREMAVELLQRHVLNYAAGEFSTAAASRVRNVPTNPGVFTAMEAAARELHAAQGLPATLDWPALEPYVTGSNRRHVAALLTKPYEPGAQYATAGVVSPQPQSPPPAEIGQLLATPMLPPTADVVVTDDLHATWPPAKRQRTDLFASGVGPGIVAVPSQQLQQPLQPQIAPVATSVPAMSSTGIVNVDPGAGAVPVATVAVQGLPTVWATPIVTQQPSPLP